MFAYVQQHKKKSVVLGFVCVLLVLLIIPPSRYALLGTFIQKDVSMVLTDSITGQAVPEADVLVGNKVVTSDQSGYLLVPKLSYGPHTLIVSKPYYESKKYTIHVPLFGNKKQEQLQLLATGRLAKVSIRNSLTGLPLQGIRISTETGSNGTTNDEGFATVVLNYESQEVKAQISGDDIVTKTVIIRPALDAITNRIEATPAGKIAFLSNSSGKLDVMISNLDGTEKKVLVPSSGNENFSSSKLYMSPNKRFAMYFANRGGTGQFLHLISLDTGTIELVTNEPLVYEPIGWVQESFLYKTSPQYTGGFVVGIETLQTYNPDTKERYTLDSTKTEGVSNADFAKEYFGSVYIVFDQVYYEKYWQASYYYGARLANKSITVNSAKPKETPKILKQWQAGYDSFIRSVRVAPKVFHYFVQLDGVINSFWELKNNVVTESAVISADDFTIRKYPSFFLSPNGRLAVWEEKRDGKNNILIGSDNGDSVENFAQETDFAIVDWYSNDYVLLSKQNSELFITSRAGIKSGNPAVIISGALIAQ